MLHVIALRGVRAHKNVSIYNTGETLYMYIGIETIGQQTTTHAK